MPDLTDLMGGGLAAEQGYVGASCWTMVNSL